MDMKFKEACEKALDEIEILEFGLEDIGDFGQRLDVISQLLKKLLLLDMLQLLQSVEIDLGNDDMNKFRNNYWELSARIDAVIYSIRNHNRLTCDDTNLYIIEKMLPYLKGNIKSMRLSQK